MLVTRLNLLALLEMPWLDGPCIMLASKPERSRIYRLCRERRRYSLLHGFLWIDWRDVDPLVWLVSSHQRKGRASLNLP